ncbi:MAG: hypothetical protein ACRDQ4_26195 [Pseudonocardiaceae bacterium]
MRTPALPLPSCCAGRWARCRARRGAGGSGCAPSAGYVAGQLARAALVAGVEFALGAQRIAPLSRLLQGLAETDWTDALDRDDAQVALASSCPPWWPAATRLLIRRVRLDINAGQVSTDPRSRRRRTLHPDQRALPLAALAELDAVEGSSFIVTNLDVSTPEQAAAIEHWYRHRTQIENIVRDATIGAALRHLPSGYPQLNTTWMGAALLAVTIADWHHHLTATPGPDRRLTGHGVRDGQAMITTLRHKSTTSSSLIGSLVLTFEWSM